ncbi:hypothetical protein [Streptomyces coeruleorubidus]|uniref:hypothetical protein n=1 Tax=Streptomyces coeruleorubidus TaxID=116188 RepID=UPI0033B119FC
MVSSATPEERTTIAEEAGAAQALTAEREAEIREWRDELGARKDFAAIGPYCALHDSLAEIDRLRTELKRARAEALREAAKENDCRAEAMLFRGHAYRERRLVSSELRRLANQPEGGAR